MVWGQEEMSGDCDLQHLAKVNSSLPLTAAALSCLGTSGLFPDYFLQILWYVYITVKCIQASEFWFVTTAECAQRCLRWGFFCCCYLLIGGLSGGSSCQRPRNTEYGVCPARWRNCIMLHCWEGLYETFGTCGILALLLAAISTALLQLNWCHTFLKLLVEPICDLGSAWTVRGGVLCSMYFSGASGLNVSGRKLHCQLLFVLGGWL